MIWKSKSMDRYAFNVCKGMQDSRPDKLQHLDLGLNCGAIISKSYNYNRFAIIISGGGGNGPLFPGYVGAGLADAAVIGAAYAAPNAYGIYEAALKIGEKHGVLLLYNNFAGDYLNNDMARELLEIEGITVEEVVCNDDIATAIDEPKAHRGGRSGIALLIKIAGACADMGMSLQDTAALLREARNRLGSISMHVNFADKEITYGGGFSGEPGLRNLPLCDPENAVKIALDLLIEDLKPEADEKLYVLVNRLRLTSYADSYIMLKHIKEILSKKHSVSRIRTAAYSNILDIYGYDISIICMDRRIEQMLEAEVSSDSLLI